MENRLRALALLVLLTASAAQAAEKPDASGAAMGATAAATFLDLAAIDLQTIPAPPAAGSLAAQADLEAVLQAQAWRTPEEVAWAKFIEKYPTVFEVFGDAGLPRAWFTKDNLPATAAFFKQITADLNAAGAVAKKLYKRERPFKADSSVHPCVAMSAGYSYPSGHALVAYGWAEVLARIFPEHSDEIYVRAHRAAWGRVIGGVHYPSDTVGSRIFAQALITLFLQNPEFRAALEKCRAEAEPFLLKKAA